MSQSYLQENTLLLAAITLPQVICFRVTRFCNARCGFCLAPPDGGIHPSAALLKERIDWLFKNGVRTIHFCGGEPTIHHDLCELIQYVKDCGKKSRLTTNGISIADKLIHTLGVCKTEVKVSLHGPKEHHDHIVGREAYENTISSIQRLISKGVSTSVQCTIVKDHTDIVDWNINFCLRHNVKRVSFLPFIPRGSGQQSRSTYELSVSERRALQSLIKEKRRRFTGRIDVRLLDFNVMPIYVAESDGRLVLESNTEAGDKLICNIPQRG